MDKARRISSVKNSIDSRDEVVRRLPEIDAIYDDTLREQVITYFYKAVPDRFWERPASITGKYHPPDESKDRGLWLHTKRVFAIYSHMSESFAEMRLISEHQRNCGKAAALIHDTYQSGWPSSPEDYAEDHDVIAAAIGAFVSQLDDEVIHLVHKHMGPWGGGNNPRTYNELLFHLSDLIAAWPEHRPAVYYPVEELVEQFPDLRTIDVDENTYV